MATDTSERRRIALVDGDVRSDLAVPIGASLQDALDGIGVRLAPAARVLIARDGAELARETPVATLPDGAMLSVVDPDAEVPAPRRGRRPAVAGAADRGRTAALWAVGTAGLLAIVLGLLFPASFVSPLRWIAVVLLAVASVAVGATWALRARGTALPALAPLALAFGAGVCAVPVLPAATASTAALLGLASAAVLAAAMALLVRDVGVRAGVATGSILLVAVAGVWGAGLLFGLAPAGAAAIVLGATPVALRALPAFLVDVPPGQFIEFARFQRLRWTVREQLPEAGERVTTDSVRRLVDDSSARLIVGSAALSLAAAVAAPLAVPAFRTSDPLTFGGQIAVLAASSLALLLGARRSAVPALHVMPRVAAIVVLVVAVHAVLALVSGSWSTVAATVLLVVGVVVGLVAVPVGRGASSLFWSRAGDLLETLVTVLALPAALVAGGVIDLLRGMMAT